MVVRGPRRLLAAIVELGAIGPLAAFMVLGPLAGALLLVATADDWYPPLEGLSGLGALAAIVVATVVLAGLSLVPTHATSLVAGMRFGAVLGTGAALLGIVGAAALGFLVLRRLTRDRALLLLDRRPRAAAVHRALVERRGRTIGLIALVRLSPVMPFAGTNLVMAAAGVRLREFLIGSVLGQTPRVVAVVVAGAGLSELDLSRSGDVRLAVVGGAATVAALVVIGRIARRALRETADGLGPDR
ncbi:MAG: TVP38/TMEM64 family protein [Planctomycetota bacterium JB042]